GLGRPVERLAGEIDQVGERLLVLGGGELRQNLAVERAAGETEARGEPAVGEPVLVGGRVDADDPERTEVALLGAAVAGGVLARLLDRLLGHAVGVRLDAEGTAGELEDLLALLPALVTPLGARHGSNLVSRP